MRQQIAELKLQSNSLVIDLGSGTGDFVMELAATPMVPTGVRVVAVDLIPEALLRTLKRLRLVPNPGAVGVLPMAADLEVDEYRGIPIRSGIADAVLASLLVSYVSQREVLLREMFELLKPGGRLVVSSPNRDADTSKIYREGIVELSPAKIRSIFGVEVERDFEELQRDFLNAGAQLLDLEERGVFQFLDPDELWAAVEQAGFKVLSATPGLGDPPLVTVVAAQRR
jgi:SAM-dependent methyltransferase